MLTKFKNLFPKKKDAQSSEESTRDVQLESSKKGYSSVGVSPSDVMDIVGDEKEPDKIVEETKVKAETKEEENKQESQQRTMGKQAEEELNSESQAQFKQSKPIVQFGSIQQNHQEIDIKINKNWIDRAKEQQPEPALKKKQVITIKEPILFILLKEEAKHSKNILASIIAIKQRRFILMQGGYFFSLQQEKGDSSFKVKSVATLKNLFKIIISNNQVTFCFFNDELDKKKMPKAKIYLLSQGNEQKNRILTRVRGEINKLGYDFALIK